MTQQNEQFAGKQTKRRKGLKPNYFGYDNFDFFNYNKDLLDFSIAKIRHKIKTFYAKDYELCNRILEIVENDNTVEACYNTIFDTLNGLDYTLNLENKEKLNNKTKFLNDFVLKNLEVLCSIAFKTLFYGNATTLLYYQDEAGLQIPQKMEILPFNRVFKDDDGKIFYYKDNLAIKNKREYLNPLVYIYCESFNMHMNRNGDGSLFNLAPLVILKQGGLEGYQYLIKNFSYPTEIFYLNNPNQTITLTDGEAPITIARMVLEAGSSHMPKTLALGANDRYESHTFNVNPVAHDNFYKMLKKEIEIWILGQNLTSDVTGGSYASARTHEKILRQRTQSIANFTARIITKVLNTILLANDISDKVIFKFSKVIDLDKEQAERDKLLNEQGVELSLDYYVENYGFNREDIKINRPNQTTNTQNTTSLKVNNNLSDSKFTPEQQEIENLVGDALKSHNSNFRNDVIEQIKASISKDDLIERFSELLSKYNPEADFKDMHKSLITADIFGYVQEKTGE